MAGIEIRRVGQADESRTFEYGSFELVTIAGVTIGRASYEPGWIWSEHVGKPTGEKLCQVEHAGLVVSGRTGVRMADGTEAELTTGTCSRSAQVTTPGSSATSRMSRSTFWARARTRSIRPGVL
jgi:hypothetical protein